MTKQVVYSAVGVMVLAAGIWLLMWATNPSSEKTEFGKSVGTEPEISQTTRQVVSMPVLPDVADSPFYHVLATKTDEELTAALRKDIRDVESLNAHFEALVHLARGSERGPAIMLAMAQIIRDSRPTSAKKEAVDRFAAWATDTIDNGHPTIRRWQALHAWTESTGIQWGDPPFRRSDTIPAYGYAEYVKTLCDYSVSKDVCLRILAVYTMERMYEAGHVFDGGFIGKVRNLTLGDFHDEQREEFMRLAREGGYPEWLAARFGTKPDFYEAGMTECLIKEEEHWRFLDMPIEEKMNTVIEDRRFLNRLESAMYEGELTPRVLSQFVDRYVADEHCNVRSYSLQAAGNVARALVRGIRDGSDPAKYEEMLSWYIQHLISKLREGAKEYPPFLVEEALSSVVACATCDPLESDCDPSMLPQAEPAYREMLSLIANRPLDHNTPKVILWAFESLAAVDETRRAEITLSIMQRLKAESETTEQQPNPERAAFIRSLSRTLGEIQQTR